MKIILSHNYHDFDALASMVAVQKIHPDALLIIEGKFGSYVQDFLALAKEQFPYYRLKDIDISKIRKIFLVDTNDLSRAIGNRDILKLLNNIDVEIIDHHPYYGSKGDEVTVHMVGACTTILVEKIISLGLRLSSLEATLMALGIYDDTGSLLFESTTSRDIMAAAYLVEQGAQLGVVSQYLRRPLTIEQMDLFQQLLDNGATEKYQELPVYISYAKSEKYVQGLSLLAQKIGEIENAEVWFIVVMMENKVYIVGRSRTAHLPVNKIAAAFGGAGQLSAASAVVKSSDLNIVIHRLKSEINQNAGKPILVRDIMSYPVKTVTPQTKMENAGKLLLKYGHTGVPVVENNKLVGVISRRDIDKALKHGLKHAPVKGFMTRDVITVHPDLGSEEAQKLMIQHDIGRLPVVDNGKLVGIVSRSDVLRLVYGSIVPTTSELARERSRARKEDIIRLIRQLPGETCHFLEAIRDTAENMGYKVYLVGGFVRDLLLGVPTTDIDIVVEGNGLQFAEKVKERLEGKTRLILHESFGTARLVMNNETHIDIAGSRREEYEFPGALPIVEESTLKDDLFRRDFTINAMALCLNKDHFGELIDYYGGLRDLEQGEIRFLHNLSFIDDPTRILRAVRFAGRYRFRFAKVTKDAIGTALKEKVLTKISPERFTEELFLIYNEQNYLVMGRILEEYGVLESWFGEKYPWNFSIENDRAGEWELARKWLLSLININETGIRRILGKLRIDKHLHRLTLEYLNYREELLKSGLGDLCKLDELLASAPVLLLEVLAAHREFNSCLNRYMRIRQEITMEVNGNKLIDMGIKEGPEIGRILKDIRRKWLTGQIKTTGQETEYLQKIIGAKKKKD
jgi:tRNA nucleotidyltransferase (CCA-adding enzyme)